MRPTTNAASTLMPHIPCHYTSFRCTENFKYEYIAYNYVNGLQLCVHAVLPNSLVVVDEVVVDELEVTLLELAGAVVVEEDNKSLSKLVDITAVSLIARDSDRETNSKLDG